MSLKKIYHFVSLKNYTLLYICKIHLGVYIVIKKLILLSVLYTIVFLFSFRRISK